MTPGETAVVTHAMVLDAIRIGFNGHSGFNSKIQRVTKAKSRYWPVIMMHQPHSITFTLTLPRNDEADKLSSF